MRKGKKHSKVLECQKDKIYNPIRSDPIESCHPQIQTHNPLSSRIKAALLRSRRYLCTKGDIYGLCLLFFPPSPLTITHPTQRCLSLSLSPSKYRRQPRMGLVCSSICPLSRISISTEHRFRWEKNAASPNLDSTIYPAPEE